MDCTPPLAFAVFMYVLDSGLKHLDFGCQTFLSAAHVHNSARLISLSEQVVGLLSGCLHRSFSYIWLTGKLIQWLELTDTAGLTSAPSTSASSLWAQSGGSGCGRGRARKTSYFGICFSWQCPTFPSGCAVPRPTSQYEDTKFLVPRQRSQQEGTRASQSVGQSAGQKPCNARPRAATGKKNSGTRSELGLDLERVPELKPLIRSGCTRVVLITTN